MAYWLKQSSNSSLIVIAIVPVVVAATAKKFLEEGAKVAIVSRGSAQLYKTRDELINQFKPNNILCKNCDFSDLPSIK